MLVSFTPKLTSLMHPWLKQYEVWHYLNFVTSGKISKVCRAAGLNEIRFRTDSLYNTLCRLETDEAFARRQKAFVPAYKFLKSTKLLNLLKNLPASFITPMMFTGRL